jgi:aspartate carbamoyltransferase catalytic subunit
MSTASREIDQKSAVTALRRKDLLGIAELTPDEIELILDTAEAMKEVGTRPIKKVPALRGKTVVNLFFEPSTRTRTSFEIAEKRLSADTLSIAIGTSSVVKGETLADTAMNLEAMSPDMIVLRHASSGACHLLSRICRSAIINAGDGMHEHPTQALLDAFTIRERRKQLAGLKVAIVGDLLHSRVLRSNIHLLTKMGAHVWVCGPPTLIPTDIRRFGVTATSVIDEAVRDADVIMLLRSARTHGRGILPVASRIFSCVRHDGGAPATGTTGRDDHASWPDEPWCGDRLRSCGRSVFGHPRPGGQRSRRADGRPIPAGRWSGT